MKAAHARVTKYKRATCKVSFETLGQLIRSGSERGIQGRIARVVSKRETAETQKRLLDALESGPGEGPAAVLARHLLATMWHAGPAAATAGLRSLPVNLIKRTENKTFRVLLSERTGILPDEMHELVSSGNACQCADVKAGEISLTWELYSHMTVACKRCYKSARSAVYATVMQRAATAAGVKSFLEMGETQAVDQVAELEVRQGYGRGERRPGDIVFGWEETESTPAFCQWLDMKCAAACAKVHQKAGAAAVFGGHFKKAAAQKLRDGRQGGKYGDFMERIAATQRATFDIAVFTELGSHDGVFAEIWSKLANAYAKKRGCVTEQARCVERCAFLSKWRAEASLALAAVTAGTLRKACRAILGA